MNNNISYRENQLNILNNVKVKQTLLHFIFHRLEFQRYTIDFNSCFRRIIPGIASDIQHWKILFPFKQFHSTKRVYILADFSLNNKMKMPLDYNLTAREIVVCDTIFFLPLGGFTRISNFPLLQILCCFNLKNTKVEIANVPRCCRNY